MGKIVIALGGNALLPKGASGSVEQQLEDVKRSIGQLTHLLKENQVVITHGNGPQVGNLFLQQLGRDDVPKMPLYVLDAMTQGQLGYFISSALSSYGFRCATVLTRIVVDKKDPAFRNPTKPIGPFFEKPVMEGMKQDAGRGYRLFVPSPKPIEITEKDAIESLLEKGFVVIAAGGGGIPVTKKGEGLSAVIDKDRASALVGSSLGAEILIIVTSIDSVYLNFGKPKQRRIERMTVEEAKKHLAAGEFAEGSMKPKIESAVDFIENGGKKVIICSIDNIKDAIEGKGGTEISGI